MTNKFASALKNKNSSFQKSHMVSENSENASLTEEVIKNPSSSRVGTKHIGGYFDPVVSKQLKIIALEEDTSIQSLLSEALDMLFQSRGRPMIAEKK